MREIKFRAWIPSLKQMITGVDVDGGRARFGHTYFNDDILMQYTGLKDKNGVEIYEGDILQNDRYSKLKAVVRWGDNFCRNAEPVKGIFGELNDLDGFMGAHCFIGFKLEHIEGYKSFYVSNLDYTEMQAEIIGNVYQNPELLTNN